jgi:hypothetical protein
MPHKADQLREQIRALEALVKADKAERRAAEAPIKAARRELSERLRRAVRSVDRYNQAIADQLDKKGFGVPFVNPYKLEEAERGLIEATAMFKSRLVDLMTFDLANNIEADNYPALPVLDREATIASARASYEKGMADMRARFSKPRQPDPPPTAPRWAPIEPPETL